MGSAGESVPHRKVVVVGAGSVGATYCYSLAQSDLAEDELALLRHSASVLRQAIDSLEY